jgi:hypothetical protein
MATAPKHARFVAVNRMVCPTCWSQLSWRGRVSRDGRGWGLTETDATVLYQGEHRGVVSIRYPCLNEACGAVVVTSWVMGFVGAEAIRPFADRYALSVSEQAQFELGTHRRGVWVDATGTSKVQPALTAPKRQRMQDAEAKPRSTRTVTRTPRRGKAGA